MKPGIGAALAPLGTRAGTLLGRLRTDATDIHRVKELGTGLVSSRKCPSNVILRCGWSRSQSLAACHPTGRGAELHHGPPPLEAQRQHTARALAPPCGRPAYGLRRLTAQECP